MYVDIDILKIDTFILKFVITISVLAYTRHVCRLTEHASRSQLFLSTINPFDKFPHTIHPKANIKVLIVLNTIINSDRCCDI